MNYLNSRTDKQTWKSRSLTCPKNVTVIFQKSYSMVYAFRIHRQRRLCAQRPALVFQMTALSYLSVLFWFGRKHVEHFFENLRIKFVFHVTSRRIDVFFCWINRTARWLRTAAFRIYWFGGICYACGYEDGRSLNNRCKKGKFPSPPLLLQLHSLVLLGAFVVTLKLTWWKIPRCVEWPMPCAGAQRNFLAARLARPSETDNWGLPSPTYPESSYFI